VLLVALVRFVYVVGDKCMCYCGGSLVSRPEVARYMVCISHHAGLRKGYARKETSAITVTRPLILD